MKSLSIAKSSNEVDAALDQILALSPSLVIFFGAPSFFRDKAALEKVLHRLNKIPVIGCSTAGEIFNEGVLKDSVSFMGIRFDKATVRTAGVPLVKTEDSFAAGEQIGDALNDPELKAVFLLAPGSNINGSALVEGLVSRLGTSVLISGGLAGDEIDFKKTYTCCSQDVYSNYVVAVGFYGDSLVISCGSEGGWRPFGPARRVTKVENNILYEIDDKPALQLYKQYLGDKAKNLPASGLSYPFAILRDDRSTSGLIRSALDIDHEKESLILAGNMPENCRVCLMHADTSALTQGAAQAAAEALRTHAGPEENGCALVVSCVGRRLVYGIDAEEEIEAVVDSFLPNTPIAGYYSYGEICSYRGTGRTELHNQTMTITYITERENP